MTFPETFEPTQLETIVPGKQGAMKKSPYSDEEIVRILRVADRDPVPELAKRLGNPPIFNDRLK